MNKLYNDTAVQAIANAIRSKNGSSDTYTIAEMSTALNDISYYAKPTISNVPLATFEADGLPLNSLKASIVAKQAGSGTPSPENVRPISGWSEANVSDAGKNLVEETISAASVDGSGKIIAFDDYDIQIAKVKANETYTITSNELLVCGFYTTKPSIGSVSYNGTRLANRPKTFIAPIDGYIAFRTASGYATPQCELGSNATEYVPYVEPNFYTISLGQTVYGGELDVVNGELKITDGYIASYNGETLPSTWISDRDVYAEGTTPTTGAEVVYTLASPTTVSLTPTLIKSLEGINNLSVDTGEIIELEYFKEV